MVVGYMGLFTPEEAAYLAGITDGTTPRDTKYTFSPLPPVTTSGKDFAGGIIVSGYPLWAKLFVVSEEGRVFPLAKIGLSSIMAIRINMFVLAFPERRIWSIMP
jgi:hypothetical protein